MNDFLRAMEGVKRLKPDDDYKNWRQCTGKVPYFTVDAAERMIRNIGKKGLRWYNCEGDEGCGSIHLTSKPLLNNK